MKTKLSLLFLAAFLVGIIGCSRDVEEGNTGVMSLVSVGATNGDENVSTVTLWAGQDIEAGTVSIRVEDDDSVQGNEQICITFNTIGGWELVETHVWFGDDLIDMPQTKKGNPKVGNFPYASGDITGATTWEICIPLIEWGNEGGTDGYSDLCGKTFYAAAHAALQLVDDTGTVIQTETGWGDGSDMTVGRSWATYFSVQLDCNGAYPPSVDGCETAFAYGCEDHANCFITLDQLVDDFDPLPARWGWTNGPLDVGSYSFDIYAGAGQCDLTKGTLVGMLTVDYSGGAATVTYSTYGGFQMEEVHLYVGHEILPRDNQGDFTVAPGKLGHTAEFADPQVEYTYTVEGLTGAPIYVVAHAVVCGDYDNAPIYDPVCDQCDSWILYGSNLAAGTDPLDDAIYAYDMNAKTQTLVFDPTPVDGNQNYPNANAYDPVNQRIYLGTDDGRIFYYDVDDDVFQQLTTNENFGVMACGSWYDGKFYYVQNNTNRLYEVVVDDVAFTAIRTQIGTVPTSNGYGDIVFDPVKPGVFIGSAGSTAYWYMYDLATGIGTRLTPNVVGKHKQLAYGSDGVLYGVDATTGEFSTITYDSVNTTVTLTPYWDSDYTFTDLASGPQCQ